MYFFFSYTFSVFKTRIEQFCVTVIKNNKMRRIFDKILDDFRFFFRVKVFGTSSEIFVIPWGREVLARAIWAKLQRLREQISRNQFRWGLCKSQRWLLLLNNRRSHWHSSFHRNFVSWRSGLDNNVILVFRGSMFFRTRLNFFWARKSGPDSILVELPGEKKIFQGLLFGEKN